MALEFHRSPARTCAFLAVLMAAALGALAEGQTRTAPAAGDDMTLRLPEGFRAQVFADALGPLPFLTVAAGGDVYVKTREGGIIALRDTTGDGRADVKETSTPPPARAAAADTGPGAKLYQQACATCHMPDGSGVPGMQPALVGDKIVRGPAPTMIKVLLLGPEKALPAHKPAGGNQMPAFDSLSDEEIAQVATYVRTTFGKGATAVTAAQVKAQRPKS